MVDVARRAGVSLKTVSRVVNAEPGVKGRTTARVQAAIDALGYRRNDAASRLRRGHSPSSLGLVIEDVSNPFYSALIYAVERVALGHQYLVIVGSSEADVVRERELELAFCARELDGLLVVPAVGDHGYLAPELGRGMPIVFMDRPVEELGADAVLVDNKGGVRDAMIHLGAQGHRRIAFLGHDTSACYTARERLRGYAEGMRALGGPEDERLVAMGPHDAASVRAALDRFRSVDPPTTALITGNNRVTALVLRALAVNPRARPAIIGFDDFEFADLFQPAITVIEQDARAVGQRAAELLFRRLDGDRQPPQRIVLPTRIIARGSGEARPATW
jgi:LacI family transcriptional regulator